MKLGQVIVLAKLLKSKPCLLAWNLVMLGNLQKLCHAQAAVPNMLILVYGVAVCMISISLLLQR